jgi:hypothetical protein
VHLGSVSFRDSMPSQALVLGDQEGSPVAAGLPSASGGQAASDPERGDGFAPPADGERIPVARRL